MEMKVTTPKNVENVTFHLFKKVNAYVILSSD